MLGEDAIPCHATHMGSRNIVRDWRQVPGQSITRWDGSGSSGNRLERRGDADRTFNIHCAARRFFVTDGDGTSLPGAAGEQGPGSAGSEIVEEDVVQAAPPTP